MAKRNRQYIRPSGGDSDLAGLPTAERLFKSGGHYEIGDDKQGHRVYQFRDAPLERMYDGRYKQIDERQYQALAKYRHHAYAAGMAGNLKSVDLNRIMANTVFSGGMPASEAQAFHRCQYREAVREIGIRESAIVDAVVLHETPIEMAGKMRGWSHPLQARAVAVEVLRGAADRLCRLWGI